jgi:hypothetical protein
MTDQPTIYSFTYKPGRTVDELEEERLVQILSLSYEERFRRMMALIRVTQKLKVKPIKP